MKHYMIIMDNSAILQTTSQTSKTPTEKEMKTAFWDFIVEKGHPCIMAQNVFRLEHVDLRVYDQLGTTATSEQLLGDIRTYLTKHDFTSTDYFSLIAVFSSETSYTEKEFEKLLWKQLQLLHELDDRPWDSAVNSDPNHREFSFSLGGKAFYVVGMHPNSSRLARQSPYPALVFNLHSQFEKLRTLDAYSTVRDKIREQDEALQGNTNPMLDDFGNSSEARQYSGRQVGEEWKCPFSHKK